MNLRVVRNRLFIVLVFVTGVIVPIGMNGQLFPEIAKLRGEVIETKSKCFIYAGRTNWRGDVGYAITHFPRLRCYITEECYYDIFGRIEGKKIKRKRNSNTEYSYSYSLEQTHSIKRKIDTKDFEGIEYVQHYDSVGRVKKVEIRSNINTFENKRLISVEDSIKFDGDRLVSFATWRVKLNGDSVFESMNKLYYDSLGRLSKIEEWGFGLTFRKFQDPLKGYTSELIVDSTLSVIKQWKILYETAGNVHSYKYEIINRDSMGYGDIGGHTIFFEYDKDGNWIRQYRQFGSKKKRPYIKRKIKYLKK